MFLIRHKFFHILATALLLSGSVRLGLMVMNCSGSACTEGTETMVCAPTGCDKAEGNACNSGEKCPETPQERGCCPVSGCCVVTPGCCVFEVPESFLWHDLNIREQTAGSIFSNQVFSPQEFLISVWRPPASNV